jgi:5-methylcytosine-specific restriction protein A
VAHITPWAEGGGTDLDNLMLLCAFHHRCFDNDDWTLAVIDGERCLVPPAWVDCARTPRRVGRPRAHAA